MQKSSKRQAEPGRFSPFPSSSEACCCQQSGPRYSSCRPPHKGPTTWNVRKTTVFLTIRHKTPENEGGFLLSVPPPTHPPRPKGRPTRKKGEKRRHKNGPTRRKNGRKGGTKRGGGRARRPKARGRAGAPVHQLKFLKLLFLDAYGRGIAGPRSKN